VIVLAARAALVALGVAALALLARRRGRPALAAAAVAVVARAPLGPGLGVALVEADGRRLLVGWGKDGVRLLRDLGRPEGLPPA
jgi:flagellar protein FliO/FliZ